MTEVISIRFRSGCKTYYFAPGENQVNIGDQVIVETSQGPEFATCTEGNHEVDDSTIVKPLCAVLRMATDNDRRTAEYNRKREEKAFSICEKKIAEHGLEMKLVNVSCNFNGSKIIFFFTADGRVDFRELVRDLASVFRARIELRQIGVRDEAKMIGGLGICGRPFCCTQFLNGFLPVSIKMAKLQNLSLNPTKISGTCGRLMCCLKYEQNAYEDAAQRMPKNESFVMTPDGPGNIKSVNLLQETAKVSLDSAPETLKSYHNCELRVLRNGKGKRDGIEIPKERPERYVEEKKNKEDVPITPVITTPFYMESPGTRSNDENEEVPKREKPGRPESREKSRRRRRSHRAGGKATDQPSVKPEQRISSQKNSQPAGIKKCSSHLGGQKAEGESAGKAAGQSGGEKPRHRPHHRGGRRRNRSSSAPESQKIK